MCLFCFFKQKTAYEMRISDWSSDVCSSYLAHAIVGSQLWTVRPEPQTTRNDEVRESVEHCSAETVLDERRRAVLELLGFSPEEPTEIGRAAGRGSVCQYGSIWVVAVTLRKIRHKRTKNTRYRAN